MCTRALLLLLQQAPKRSLETVLDLTCVPCLTSTCLRFMEVFLKALLEAVLSYLGSSMPIRKIRTIGRVTRCRALACATPNA